MNAHKIEVVVVAYGPSDYTKSAVRRARQFVDSKRSITVVPASDHATHACSDLTVRVTNRTGSEGLVEILDELDDHPVLLVHDDVTLSTNGLRAMTDGLGEPNCYVVPHTNDVGMDHFVGSLPDIHHVTSDLLDSKAKGIHAQVVQKVRPSCILARRDDMVALAERHLIEPNLRLDDIDLGFFAVAAVATHEGVCTTRLGPPRMVDDSPLLVAAMIVRDEEATLPALLDSIAPLVDRIEVCDTGSVDRTIEIAREAGANIIRREWRDDFGWARNEILEQCRDAQYVLAVDADDRVICPDPEGLRRYLATYHAEYPAFEISVSSPSGGHESTVRSVRIARANELAFDGAVHEVAIWRNRPEAGPIRATSLDLISILHVGYTEEVASVKDKARRNLRIAKKQFEQDRNFKSIVEYVRSLLGAEEGGDLIRNLLEEAQSLVAEGSPPTQAFVAGMLATQYLNDGDHQEALDLALGALDLVPAEGIAQAVIAKAAEALGRPELLIDLAANVTCRPSMTSIFDTPTDRLIFEEAVIVALGEIGDLEKARRELTNHLDQRPFDRWNDLLEVLRVRTDVSQWLEPIIQTHPEVLTHWLNSNIAPAEVVSICVELAKRDEVTPDLAVQGTINALVSGNTQAIDTFAPYLAPIQPDKLDRLILEASRRGYEDVVATLTTVRVGGG